jgi:hypothetical protein
MILGITLALVVIGFVLLTALVWRKGWKLISLGPLVVFFGLALILESSDLKIRHDISSLVMSIYFVGAVLLGLFPPKKADLSNNQRKIAELEREIQELRKESSAEKKPQ